MKYVLFIFIFFSLPPQSHAQCCSPGNPLGGYGNNGTLNEKTFKLYTQYKHGYSGTYKNGDHLYAGDTKDFQRAVKEAEYNFIGAGIAWGITRKLTVEAEAGYFINKTQTHTANIIPAKQKGYGLTDLAFLIKPSLYKNQAKEIEFTPSFGLKIPLGNFKQQYQGSVLPPDLQPTTGAINLVAGFFLYKGFLAQHLRFFMIGRYEFPRANPLEVKYGNSYITSFYTSYSLSAKFTLIAQFRYEQKERDRITYQPGNGYYSSGSKKLFIVPQLTYSPDLNWDISLFSDIPLYQYYNGYQLGNTWSAAIMVSKKIIPKAVPTIEEK
jgi:hypothetical protein